MEDGLVHVAFMAMATDPTSLNPCCNGRWSRTRADTVIKTVHAVLILVVMEDGLVHFIQ